MKKAWLILKGRRFVSYSYGKTARDLEASRLTQLCSPILNNRLLQALRIDVRHGVWVAHEDADMRLPNKAIIVTGSALMANGSSYINKT
jgi:hypothetical protein